MLLATLLGRCQHPSIASHAREFCIDTRVEAICYSVVGCSLGTARVRRRFGLRILRSFACLPRGAQFSSYSFVVGSWPNVLLREICPWILRIRSGHGHLSQCPSERGNATSMANTLLVV